MPNEGDIVRNKRTGEQAVWRGGRPVPMGGGVPQARYGAPPKPTPTPTPKPYEPPSGYMGGPEQLEPIPGGPADKPDPADAPYSQSAMDSFNRAIKSIDTIKEHPGMRAAVGSGFDPAAFGSYNPFSEAGRNGKPLSGTNAAGFVARLNALKAQVFLPMVQSMKGMGALSNAEGEKLTAAIGALDDSMPEADFLSSLEDVKKDLQVYRDRSAGGPRSTTTAKRLRYNPATGELE